MLHTSDCQKALYGSAYKAILVLMANCKCTSQFAMLEWLMALVQTLEYGASRWGQDAVVPEL